MSRALSFTIWHGLVASLALHSALALPFVVNSLTPPPDDLPTLVIELQGVVSEAQAEERVAQQMLDQPQPPPPQSAPPPPPPPPQEAPPPPEPEEAAAAEPPEPQPQMAPPQQQPQVLPQAHQVQEPDEQQKAQTLRTEKDLEADRLREYVKRLTKKVQANLVYPDEGRRAGLQGNAAVSFTLTRDGEIRPGTLTIAASSGQPRLDASALATVRASAPFEPPPKGITVKIDVAFGRKKS